MNWIARQARSTGEPLGNSGAKFDDSRKPVLLGRHAFNQVHLCYGGAFGDFDDGVRFGAPSIKFWNLVKDALRAVVPEEIFAQTSRKIDGFAAGAGSVLFFEDQEVVRELQQNFSSYITRPFFTDSTASAYSAISLMEVCLSSRVL